MRERILTSCSTWLSNVCGCEGCQDLPLSLRTWLNPAQDGSTGWDSPSTPGWGSNTIDSRSEKYMESMVGCRDIETIFKTIYCRVINKDFKHKFWLGKFNAVYLQPKKNTFFWGSVFLIQCRNLIICFLYTTKEHEES